RKEKARTSSGQRPRPGAGRKTMSGGGDVLYGPKPALLERLPFHLGERSSPHKPRIPSATDLQTRLPGLVLVWDWLGIAAAGLLIDVLIDPGVAQPSRYLDIVLGATLTVNYLHLLRGYCVPSMRKVAVQVAKASLAWLGEIGRASCRERL